MKIEEEIKQQKFQNEFVKAEINLNFTFTWLAAKRAAMLKPYDISIQQFNLMRILRGQHPKASPLKLITERMIDKMSNTSRLVEKLRLKGLVERELCPKNRRQVDIKITKSGLKLIEITSKVMDQAVLQEKTLTEDEATTLNLLLDKFRG